MRSKILPALGALMVLSFAGRVGDQLFSLEAAASEPGLRAQELTAQTFDELDAWQLELEARERQIDAKVIASEITLAEARRHAEQAAKDAARTAETRVTARRLAAVYASMRVEKAAQTLSALPIEKAAPVIEAMKPEAAGAILSAMEAKTAQAISASMLAVDEDA